MNKLLLFFITIVCGIAPSFAQSPLCPNVPVLPIEQIQIQEGGKWILFGISRNPDFVSITDTRPTCSYSYLESTGCRAVTIEFLENFSFTCDSFENNQCIQKVVKRFLLKSWSEDNNGKLLLIEQELESIDNNWEIYHTSKVQVRKANNLYPLAVKLQKEQDILNFYLNNRIALVYDEEYVKVYQVCNSKVPVIIVLMSDQVLNPWYRSYILGQVNTYFNENNLNYDDFVILSSQLSINTDFIQGVPRLHVNQKPPTCKSCFQSNNRQ